MASGDNVIARCGSENYIGALFSAARAIFGLALAQIDSISIILYIYEFIFEKSQIKVFSNRI